MSASELSEVLQGKKTCSIRLQDAKNTRTSWMISQGHPFLRKLQVYEEKRLSCFNHLSVTFQYINVYIYIEIPPLICCLIHWITVHQPLLNHWVGIKNPLNHFDYVTVLKSSHPFGTQHPPAIPDHPDPRIQSKRGVSSDIATKWRLMVGGCTEKMTLSDTVNIEFHYIKLNLQYIVRYPHNRSYILYI